MIALLAFWALPVPGSLYALTTPTLESAYARIGTAAITALGADLSVSGPLIRSGVEHLELDPTHSGIHLVFMTTLLAWYASARKEVSPLVAVTRAAIAAFVAIPLQGIAVSLAIALLVVASPEFANFWLDNGLWLLTVIIGIIWIETR